jgi:hypothetical protein
MYEVAADRPVGELDRKLEQIIEALNTLEAKLQPVLIPEQTQRANDVGQEKLQSPLLERLDNLQTYLYQINSRINL